MFKEAPIARCLRLAFVGGVAGLTLASIPALAQEVQRGERVEITGSNIRRVQSETASPVQTLTREEIDRSGKTSVAELLQTLAVDNQGSVPITFGNGFATGASGISLRGLGAGSTLVLLNGRRIAPYGLADDGTKVFADLNLIPLEAVERVEILKDGGSAVYGSDAVAGVVNIILRKEFTGTVLRGSVGQSLQYGDGRETKLAITTGFGNIDTDNYNVFANFEYGKREAIQLSNRTDRGRVGKTDLRSEGFTAADTTFGGAGAGGTGAIIANGLTGGNSIIGNVRNPTTLKYYSRDNLGPGTGFTRTFPGARCTNFTDHPQGDPGGGCLIDATQVYGQVQPSDENFNFFARGSLKINDNATAYIEGNYYDDRSRSRTTPSPISSNLSSPTNTTTTAAVALGATHPDNPYFGTAARLRYIPFDVGPRVSSVDSQFSRILVGVRGTAFGWDYDTGALYSRNILQNKRTGYLQADVMLALLNPTAANVAAANAGSAAYRALPPGTVWRIGENAGLNSPALYQALSPAIFADAEAVSALVDFKASRELFQLPGGPLGVAVGTEFRHESSDLKPTTGTDRANIVGLGYSAYSGSRDVTAVYAEAIAPVIKTVELSVAARGDHYSDVGNSFTPKAGIKWTPIRELALRGTFSKGFRAPNAAETGGGTAAFATSADPVRCALGVTTVCAPQTIAIISAGNPAVEPERSKTYTAGFVADPTRSTTISADYFKIVRKNEIVAGTGTNIDNIIAGNVIRDPANTQAGIVGDPGVLSAVLNPYQNAGRTTVRGLDLEARQNVDLGGGYGKLLFDANWTHLFSYKTTDLQGVSIEYAGTHGNCNVTNCIGTPADRVNASVTYSIANWSVTALANYRAAIPNHETKDQVGCNNVLVNGNDNPDGCRIGSFTTVDLSARWQATRNWQVFASIQNLFDRIPPYDPYTYGAANYNPLDYSGAIGRFFTAGARYKF